jgi:hypothetical protein
MNLNTKITIKPHFLPKFNKFDKKATIDTFFEIFCPDIIRNKKLEIAKKNAKIARSAALTLLGIGALAGVDFILSQNHRLGESKFDNNTKWTERVRVVIRKWKIKFLFLNFNRYRDSERFISTLNNEQKLKFLSYVIKNF